MPDLRPEVALERVITLLQQHFSGPVLDLVPVEGGNVARVYAFRVGAEAYVVKFNLDRMYNTNYPKELYLAGKLAGSGIPLAPIVQVGRLDDLHFAIFQRMPGKMLSHHLPEEVQAMVPQMLELFELARQVDVSETGGFGVCDDQGQGVDASWRAHFLKCANEEDERGYLGRWHRLFDETFLEREVFEELYQRMKELLNFCPEERSLVLYSSLNDLLAENGRITAALDNLGAGYGDPLDAVAALDFWWEPMGLPQAYLADQRARGREVPHAQERLLCYALHYALKGMLFYAKGGDEAAYQTTKEIIRRKMR